MKPTAACCPSIWLWSTSTIVAASGKAVPLISKQQLDALFGIWVEIDKVIGVGSNMNQNFQLIAISI